MQEKKPASFSIEWETIVWEQTPYKNVFIKKIKEGPFYTVMALKLQPGAIIPLHRHNRELSWTETIVLQNGGWFEIKNDREIREIKTQDPVTIVIKTGEAFGLKNIDPSSPLYFSSRMEPGFTGYQEIEEIK